MKSYKIITLSITILIFSYCSVAAASTESSFENLYNKMDKYMSGDTPRFIESFSWPYPGGNELEHKAYSYDSVLAVLAFLNRGEADDIRRAKVICEGFIFVQDIDPEADGRIRDAYWATNLAGPSIYDWGSRCGNLAWIIIALVECYNNDPINNEEYLESAINIGNFIINEYKDEEDRGFITGYYLDWGSPGNVVLLNSKSTEENTDVYVAFMRLYEATNDSQWIINATHAKSFVRSMYTRPENTYYCGTDEQGEIVTDYFSQAEDANAYAILAFNSREFISYTKSFIAHSGDTVSPNAKKKEEVQMLVLNEVRISYPYPVLWLEENCLTTDFGFTGFDFNTDQDGVWFEGTGNMCVAYDKLNLTEPYDTYLNELRNAQIEDPIDPYRDGAIPSASRDYLSTNLGYWYFNSPHVAATCWYIFAEERYNPLDN